MSAERSRRGGLPVAIELPVESVGHISEDEV